MYIDCVTITGADNSINPMDLYDLTKEFPFVEWGILVSEIAEGSKRFPDLSWLHKFREFKIYYEKELGRILQASCHLCGRWVNNLLIGGDQFTNGYGMWLDMFQRMQINTHAEQFNFDLKAFEESIAKRIFLNNNFTIKQFIMQLDGVNDKSIVYPFMVNSIMNGLDIVPIFDTSSGAGSSPKDWPKPLKPPWIDYEIMYCGYAGGLGPENLEKELKNISKVVDNFCDTLDFLKPEWMKAETSRLSRRMRSDTQRSIWIDMETKIRSNNDQKFDLDKVRTCLELAEPYVKIDGK